MKTRKACFYSKSRWVVKVPSNTSKGVLYEVTFPPEVKPKCSCEGFAWRGKCSHVNLEDFECDWVEGMFPAQTEEEKAKNLCPKCGNLLGQIATWAE